MANGNHLTANCSNEALKRCSSQMTCPVDVGTAIHKSMSIRGQLWRVDALLVVEVVLAAVIVGIGVYGQRYRHHPITRFVFLGANTLFLPVISSIASTISLQPNYAIPFRISLQDDYGGLSALVARCSAIPHVAYFLILASLVQVVMINTSTIVCVDDREGECRGPPLGLLIQGIWIVYLGVSLLEPLGPAAIIFVPPYALLWSKIGLKYYAFEKARRSVALGRNPGLVFVYMQQLQAQEAANQQHVGEPLAGEGEDEGVGAPPPPPLLVMRESEQQVEKHPQGYAFMDDSSRTTLNQKDVGLVTIDRVWRLDNSILPIATPRSKDLCLSFALFKLLRCRFARYKLTNSGFMGSTRDFFRSLLLHNVGADDMIFNVITEELSFVHDYYYSSLPISYSNGFLPFLGIFLSNLTIVFCICLTAVFIVGLIQGDLTVQVSCAIWCVKGHLVGNPSHEHLGVSFFDYVPVLLLLVLVVTAEVRDMASYICSNWTKVTLICHYINRNSSPCSFFMQKWVSILLRCRCKLMKHWNEEMSQCTILLLPQKTTTPIVLVSHLFRALVPDHRRKVKVPSALKVSIMNAVRSMINGRLSNGAESLRRNQQVGESFLWACSGRGTSDIILTWHIATCIFEVKHPDRQSSQSDHKITATHLSKYCAYLMIWCPELLPDNNNAWIKGLYKAVKKDAEHSIAGFTKLSIPEEEYQKLVNLLGANSKHEVLKNGLKLGKQLVETINSEETVWKLLADFWSEMILYVAPSDNLKGHSEAIARGGELITLLWALLLHAGIVSRPGEEEEDGVAATSSGAV